MRFYKNTYFFITNNGCIKYGENIKTIMSYDVKIIDINMFFLLINCFVGIFSLLFLLYATVSNIDIVKCTGLSIGHHRGEG